MTTRVETNGDVWVYWQSASGSDVSRVRNVSAGGLFLEVEKPLAKGQMADFHFLVQEGSIRAEAVVRRYDPGEGLGLKFVAVERESGPHLAELLARLRGVHRSKN